MSGSINRSGALALMLEVCPGAGRAWQEHEREWGGEAAPYLGMAVFSRYLVDMMTEGETTTFPAVFAAVEQLINEGDEEVQDFAFVGFLESLQNQASWTEQGADAFLPWLNPSTREAWHELQTLWDGKDGLADVIRAEREED